MIKPDARTSLRWFALPLASFASFAVSCRSPDERVWSAPPASGRSVMLEETGDPSANASLGDLDGDGDLDVVLAKGRHWPHVDVVLMNDGTGGFTRRHEVGGSADRTYTAAVIDVDGDSDLDLVVGNDRPDDKRVYRNDGSGNFELAGTFGDPDWPTRNVTVVDLTGDGRPEIVVANRGDQSPNVICVNDGDGGYPDWKVLSTESATTIAAADLDGDGDTDLVVPHRDGGQSYVFFNDGRGGFEDRRPFGPEDSGTRAVAIGDLNGDGHLDVLIGDEDAGGAQAYLNDGNRFESPYPVGENAGLVYSIAIADLDGDGDADIVFGNRGAPGAILWNDGSGRTFRINRFGGGQGAVYGLAIGDVDGDGTLDIVSARSGAPNTLLLAVRARERVDVSTSTLDLYVGAYRLSSSWTLTITRDGERLFLAETEESKYELFAVAPTTFFLKVDEAEVTFFPDDEGVVDRLILQKGADSYPGTRIE